MIGTFIETSASISVLAPILAPILAPLAVHFGIGQIDVGLNMAVKARPAALCPVGAGPPDGDQVHLLSLRDLVYSR